MVDISVHGGVGNQNKKYAINLPVPSSSKHANAFLITSSGSVPFSFSPNMVRNIVKLMGPGAAFTISFRYASVGSLPRWENKNYYQPWKLVIL